MMLQNKTLVAGLLVAVLGVFATSANATMYILSGDMDVEQAGTNGGFGGGTGIGTGTISGDYDDVTNILNYTLTWADLTSDVNNIHFHVGAPGVAGGVDLGVPGPWASPQIGTGIVLDAGQEANLLAGLWYVNVHTEDFPGGEIRGQVLASAVPVPAAAWLFGSALLGLRLRRRDAH